MHASTAARPATPPKRWPLVVFPTAKLLLHLTFFAGYGFFRDELYYMACAERLDFGYVDHPPFSVAALWLVRVFAGDSQLAMRAIPAVLGAATVLVTGLLTRRMGGRGFAQSLAMITIGLAPVLLSLQHFYSMNAFDVLVWALAALVWSERERLGERRMWLVLGVVLGIGLLNKLSVLWLGAGLLVGLLATERRRELTTIWPWLAAILAAALVAPYIGWEIAHDWPTLEFVRRAMAFKMAEVSVLGFLGAQIEMMNPVVAPLWATGLVWLLLGARARPFRGLGWAYVTVLAILIVSGSSRANYLAPAYVWLLAAGAVATESAIHQRAARAAVVAVVTVTGIVLLPFGLPVLPVEAYIDYAAWLGVGPSTEENKDLGALPQFYADMHGWDALADTAATIYDDLPEHEQAHAIIRAPDYGVAGAVELRARKRPLPPVISGHNNYWLWALAEVQPSEPGLVTAIVIDGDEAGLLEIFERVDLVAHTDCGYCMPYEHNRPVFVARGLKVPLAAVWPGSKNFN